MYDSLLFDLIMNVQCNLKEHLRDVAGSSGRPK